MTTIELLTKELAAFDTARRALIAAHTVECGGPTTSRKATVKPWVLISAVA